MTHRIIIIESVTPSPSGASAVASGSHEPEFEVSVKFRPSDSLTPSQIGNEVARVERLVNRIIEGTPDA